MGKVLATSLLLALIVSSSILRIARYRYLVAFLLGLTAIALNLVPLAKVPHYVNLDVIGLVIGMSIMTVFIEHSGLARLTATVLTKYVRSKALMLFALSFLAGLISIALENVSVVLIVAPIAFEVALRLGIDVRALIISVALASNLSGSATMIGDPQAIITAGYFSLSFSDFIVYAGKPSMFFFTLVAMVLACLSITYVSSREGSYSPPRREGEELDSGRGTDRDFIIETLTFLSVKIALLTLRNELGIPLTLAAVVAVSGLSITRLLHGDRYSVVRAFREGLDWRIALFLIGVFVISGAFSEQGLASDLARLISSAGTSNLFVVTSIIIWLSVAASSVIDNVPYIATMLPVMDSLHKALGVDAVTLAWSLLLGATLGGNLTFIGASANIVAVRLLEKYGIKTSFRDFIKLSLPFNTVSVISGWVLYEVLWILT